MTKAQLRTLNALCARAEALQIKLKYSKGQRQAYEAVARAKDALLEALRIAEGRA